MIAVLHKALKPARVLEVFADRHYTTTPHELTSLDLDGWGYRWLRLDMAD